MATRQPDVVFTLITDGQALLAAQWTAIAVGSALSVLFIASLISLKRATNFRRTRWGLSCLPVHSCSNWVDSPLSPTRSVCNASW